MEPHLRAGIAVYNAGEYHAAHDAWEDYWLDLDAGTDDERFLHGLIQFTAAVHHADGRNWEGMAGLCASACDYLDGLGERYRGVNVGDARTYLERLRADPELVERTPPLRLAYDGRELDLGDIEDFETLAVAAGVLADESETYDEAVLERGIDYARSDLDDGNETSPFVTLVMDFGRGTERRPLAYRRLREHLRRREHRERDAEGLFDPDDDR